MDDVRCVVGEVERVGQVRVPEGVDGDENPQKAGDTRDERAGRYISSRRAEPSPRRPPGDLGAGVTGRPRRSPCVPGAGEPGRGGYPGQGARQAPPVDRPLFTEPVRAAPPAPHEAGSCTASVACTGPPHAWPARRLPASCRPQPPEEEEGGGADGQRDRDPRYRRGPDRQLCARQLRGARRATEAAAAGSNRPRCVCARGR